MTVADLTVPFELADTEPTREELADLVVVVPVLEVSLVETLSLAPVVVREADDNVRALIPRPVVNEFVLFFVLTAAREGRVEGDDWTGAGLALTVAVEMLCIVLATEPKPRGLRELVDGRPFPGVPAAPDLRFSRLARSEPESTLKAINLRSNILRATDIPFPWAFLLGENTFFASVAIPATALFRSVGVLEAELGLIIEGIRRAGEATVDSVIFATLDLEIDPLPEAEGRLGEVLVELVALMGGVFEEGSGKEIVFFCSTYYESTWRTDKKRSFFFT